MGCAISTSSNAAASTAPRAGGGSSLGIPALPSTPTTGSAPLPPPITPEPDSVLKTAPLKGTSSAKSITFEEESREATTPSQATKSVLKPTSSSLSIKASSGESKGIVRFDESSSSAEKPKKKSGVQESSATPNSRDRKSPSLSHERQKSVTGDHFSLDEEDPDSTPLKRISGGSTHSGDRGHHRSLTSNIHESLIPMNPLSTKIREFYSGLEADDNIIGSGNWGVVKVVTRLRDGRKFACKVVKLDEEMTDEQFRELRAEIDALRQLDHVGIAKLYETFEEPGEYLYLIMELLTGGELYSALVERSLTGRFDEIRTRRLIKKMMSALAYLHDKGLVHRDIKLENFCFRGPENEDEIVLIDFGLAKLYEMRGQETEIVGSCYYIAPEIIEGHYSGPTPDMWSMGVILFMMLAGRPPFDGSSDTNIMRRAARGKFHMEDEVWKTQISSLATDFVKRCLTVKAKDRLTSKEALRHPFLTASDEVLIEAGAGDDPALALAPAVIPSVVSAQLGGMMLRARNETVSGEARTETSRIFLDKLQEFASKHELVRLFAQAVAFSLSREEVRDLSTMFVFLDRDHDGVINPADLEVGLMGASEQDLEEETRLANRNSIIDPSSGRVNPAPKSKFFHSVDDATRFRRKRRREANFLFAAMDVGRRGNVSLNEFIAATLDARFFADEALLRDAFGRLCKSNHYSSELEITVPLLDAVLGTRYSEKRAKRLVQEFAALARLEAGVLTPTAAAASSGSGSMSEKIRRSFTSLAAGTMLTTSNSEALEAVSLSSRRVDVDVIGFEDFCRAMRYREE